ncbi:MAG: ubiquinone/menaquinone biosynthesis methyltransferase [Chloroflexi bacterium]|nr:ubiquinone/menaquinone biosynthesis methyltransferase [Chloroflexota bacterium]
MVTATPAAEKARFVRSMFDAIAGRYDLMNRLMTGGRDAAWRRLTADAVFPETVTRVLDAGAGTGDLSFAVARLAPHARVIALDFAPEMLRLAQQKRSVRAEGRQVMPVLGDAMALPLEDNSVEGVVTGFTLRNVEDVSTVFAECRRVLRPGGRLAILELTPTRTPVFSTLFRLYFHRLVPLLGALVSGRKYAYQYLPHSVDRFPDAKGLCRLLLDAGFGTVTYRKLALGTVALHVAEKGESEPRDTTVPAAAPRLVVREASDPTEWNETVARIANAHVMQSWEWGELRRATGWTPRRLLFERDGQPVAAASVSRRPLPGTPLGVAYCHKGPALDYRDTPLFEAVLARLAEEARDRRCVFLKVDPDVEWTERHAVAALRRIDYVPAPEQVQSRGTVVVDVEATEAQLLARMSSTWRRYVKKAERDGVRVRAGGAGDLQRFYQIYEETEARQGFIIRPYRYYANAFPLMKHAGLVDLLVAEVHGQVEAAIFLFHFGARAWYLWGATSSIAQKVHAMYLLQWEAMRRARELGCDTYDMYGAPDDPNDKSDPLYGVYYLKKGFGGRYVRWIGAYDYVASPALYTVWDAALPRALYVWRAIKGERAPAQHR